MRGKWKISEQLPGNILEFYMNERNVKKINGLEQVKGKKNEKKNPNPRQNKKALCPHRINQQEFTD